MCVVLFTLYSLSYYHYSGTVTRVYVVLFTVNSYEYYSCYYSASPCMSPKASL